jgi:IclR family transcriptional regulator, KDG regulon repressor
VGTGRAIVTREIQTVRAKDSYSIQSVDNALTLLEALCDEDEVVRISHLSERLGMNKTSVFRLMATFENRGYVEKESGSGRYRLGISAYEMGQKFLSRMGLLRKARPVMDQLGRRCNEAVYLVIRRQEEALFLDMIETSHQVKVVSLLGNRYPLSKVAAGKIILAHTPAEEPLSGPKKKQAKTSVLSPEELHQIRQQGFCMETGSPDEGIVAIAVPLFRTGGELCGCLCMVGPEYRMTAEKVQNELLPQLMESGTIISSKLGHLGQYL